MTANQEGGQIVKIVTKTPRQAVKASWRRLAVVGVGALLAGVGALAGPTTAAAATVDCSSASLQTAIAWTRNPPCA
jgi:uncharacterized membrane protein